MPLVSEIYPRRLLLKFCHLLWFLLKTLSPEGNSQFLHLVEVVVTNQWNTVLNPLQTTLRLPVNECSMFIFTVYTTVSYYLKVPLTSKFSLSRQKSPFCFDHFGEKIIVVRFFLNFLWSFKIRKIRATVVHRQVTRRMGRVGRWRQPGKPFRLERGDIRGHWGIVQLQRKKFTTMSYRCVAANCCNVVDLAKCILAHNIPFFGN